MLLHSASRDTAVLAVRSDRVTSFTNSWSIRCRQAAIIYSNGMENLYYRRKATPLTRLSNSLHVR